MKYSFSIVLICLYNIVFSQNSIQGQYGFGIIDRFDAFTNSLIYEQQKEVFEGEPDQRDQAPFTHIVGLNYNKNIYSWLGVFTGLNYQFSNRENSISTSAISQSKEDGLKRRLHNYAYNNISIGVGTELDILWKNTDDALLFYFGGKVSLIHRSEEFIVDIDTTNSPQHFLSFTRKGYSFQGFIGCAWEEYLSDKWGYRIYLQAYPTYYFIPQKLVVIEDIYNYQVRTKKKYTYHNAPVNPDNNELEKERVRNQAFFLGASISYRF